MPASSFFDRLSYVIYLATVFLLPFFFIPSDVFFLQSAKIIILASGVILSLVLWLIGELKRGSLPLPFNWLSFSAIGLVIASAVSALFSKTVVFSFLGAGTETSTVAFVCLSSGIFVLSSLILKNSKRARMFFAVVVLSGILTGLYQASRFFGGADFLSFGFFNNIASNTLGNWTELSIFFGGLSILSLFLLDMEEEPMIMRLSYWILLVISLFFLAVVNFREGWILLAALSFLGGLYLFFSFKKPVWSVHSRRILFYVSAFLLISIAGVFWGGNAGQFFARKFNLNVTEVGPSWSATFDVSKNVFKEDPILGIGPNRFNRAWSLYKPVGINETLFWDTDFEYGSGYIPSMIVMTGALGLLSWLVFFASYLFFGVRALFVSNLSFSGRNAFLSTFFSSLFLWFAAILYTPGAVSISFAFILSGVSLSILYHEKVIRRLALSFSIDRKVRFVATAVIIFFIVGFVFLGYSYSKRIAAAVLFQKGIALFQNNKDYAKAANYIKRASRLSPVDAYSRALSELALVRLDALIKGGSITSENAGSLITPVVSEALEEARRAVKLDYTSYNNWMAIGRVYESILPLGSADAYKNAKDSYIEAAKRGPHNPGVFLSLARLELFQKDLKAARSFALDALREKSDYAEAIFLISHIDLEEGKTEEGLKGIQRAAALRPNDPSVFYALGLLYYDMKNWTLAAEALDRVLKIEPSNANGRYYLGLSLYRLNRIKDAIAEFEILKSSNPGNKEIERVLKSMRSERSPF